MRWRGSKAKTSDGILIRMSGKTFTIVIKYVGKGLYSATCPELPDCHAVADSVEDARRALEETIKQVQAGRSNESISENDESTSS
jgi:predicted RNase H-like HicB family nuclease